MPKLKTHQATAKRFRLTKKGKTLRLRRTFQHFARHGSGSALRRAAKEVPVFGAQAKKVRALLGVN